MAENKWVTGGYNSHIKWRPTSPTSILIRSANAFEGQCSFADGPMANSAASVNLAAQTLAVQRAFFGGPCDCLVALNFVKKA